jgi:hypothetical protein
VGILIVVKSKIAIIALVAATVALAFAAYRTASNMPDKLAVAGTFGKFQAFLLSTNYPAAYSMMSSDFRNRHSLSVFQARDQYGALTRGVTRYDWHFGSVVHVNGPKAELRLKYNESFGTVLHFLKEEGQWRLTDETSGFETLWP